jgi:AbrB family looped-hinge helix DNA binding protein
MSLLELDKKGRVTVPKEYRRELGLDGKILVINAGDHLKLIPVPKDPIQALRGAFTTKKPFKQLRKQAEAEAEKEIRARR